MNLDTVDKKLITYLYHNFREPLSKIAKATNLSRDQVEYRIKKYEKEGLIIKFLTIYNYPKLGFNEFYTVLIKLNLTKDKRQIKDKLEKLKNTISIGESLTENDLFVNILTKDEPEFNEILFDFIKENSEKIKNYSIMKRFDIEFYPLKNWDLKIKENTYQINNILPLSISSQEKLILKLLEEDGRIKIIDIAKSLKISAELALYKLNQLKKKEIILGNRILFNHEKFGYRFANLILNLKEISNETIKNIKQFCKNHKTINALSFNYGENNTIIQFLYKEDSELREGIRNVKSKLDTNIVSSKLLLLEDEKYVKTLPF